MKTTKKISDFFQCCFGLHLLMFSRRQNRQKKFQIFFSAVSAFTYLCSAEGKTDKKNFRFFSVLFRPSPTYVQQKAKPTKKFQIFFSAVPVFTCLCSAEGENDKKNFRFFQCRSGLHLLMFSRSQNRQIFFKFFLIPRSRLKSSLLIFF